MRTLRIVHYTIKICCIPEEDRKARNQHVALRLLYTQQKQRRRRTRTTSITTVLILETDIFGFSHLLANGAAVSGVLL